MGALGGSEERAGGAEIEEESRGASGEGSPRGRGVSALILSRGLYRRGAASWSDGDAGAVGRTVGGVGRW